jgi:hypothetical protein
MYINEIMLFIGRKLSNSKEELGDNSKAFYGLIPQDLLFEYQSQI